jgi:ADP-ribose pyrophosphatase
MIKQLSTKIVYENKWMKLREDSVEFLNGSKGIYSVVEKADFAMVIPFEKNGFHLVKQFRYPVGKSFWEFPQGSYEDNPEADPAELAKGELKEETGLTAAKMKKIGYLYEAYGYSNQAFHIFLAEDFEKGEQQLQAGEQGMETAFFTVAEFEQMISSGEIADAPSISAYGLLKAQKII